MCKQERKGRSHGWIRRVAGVALGLAIGLFASAADGKRYVNIVFIGNSVTEGAGLSNPMREAPPVKAALYLSKCPEIGSVKYVNRGRSGCTTVDYLPETSTLFPWMTAAADQFRDETWADLVFSIMLGTNDSAISGTNGCPVSPERYYENMEKIINRLLALYPDCRVVAHRPIWYSPNTYNGSKYMEEGLRRLESYYPQLRKLVDDYATRFPGQVFLGDTAGFDYFKEHHLTDFQAERGNAGVFYLHPNAEGAVRLGDLWGEAILRALDVKKGERETY